MNELPEPETRVEQLLAAIAGESGELPDAETRIEKYLKYIVENGGGGGEGGTTNYNALSNKPTINGNTLAGDKTPANLGIQEVPAGGAAGQVLSKASAADHDTAWANPTPPVPVGTVIYYAGKTAPVGYLSCDGTAYAIADYPALAAFFAANYGAANYWGGDGTATFAVPDWQGEFFRAAGPNGRTDQGSGADVGVHQDATLHSTIYPTKEGSTFLVYRDVTADGVVGRITKTMDTGTEPIYTRGTIDISLGEGTSRYPEMYTARPTNTSLLVCIKAT